MARYRKSDVDMYSSGPAVNVKNYRYPTCSLIEDAFKCSEAVASRALQYAWESAVRRFWEDVQEAARDIFGKHVKVYSEGRSGGWLVVNGINQDVESWDALALSKWARLVKWCECEIAFLASEDYVREDIEVNRWAELGAEMYNHLDTQDGRVECLVDLKAAHLPKGGN